MEFLNGDLNYIHFLIFDPSGLTNGSGFFVAFNDIGGKFSGLVFSISNSVGMLSGVLAPYVVAAITPNVSTVKSHSSSNRNIHLLKHFSAYPV